MRPRLAGDVQTVALRLPDQRDGLLRRDVADVVAAAGLAHQRQIPRHLPPLALRGDALVAVQSRVLAVVNAAAAEQGVVLAVRADQLAQPLRLAHRGAHHVVGLHAAPVVGKRADIGRHGRHVGKHLALLPHRNRPVGQHLHAGVARDDAALRFERFETVRHGVQVRHRAHRAVAAVRRRARARVDRLLIGKTRLAEVNMHIRKAGEHVEGMKCNCAALRGNRKIAGNKTAVFIHERVFHEDAHGRFTLLLLRIKNGSCRRQDRNWRKRAHRPAHFAVLPVSLYQLKDHSTNDFIMRAHVCQSKGG